MSPCVNSFCINEHISPILYDRITIHSLFYPGVAIVFVLSFSHLPVSSVGCSFFKSLGIARGARLLVAVGRGGVCSVRSQNRVT